MTKKTLDFRVTKQRQSVWRVELEMLEEFKRVCKKHHLNYFASRQITMINYSVDMLNFASPILPAL